MSVDRGTELYEKGLQLAECGNYQDALDCIQEYLSSHPDDGQGWNDLGAIVYCMGRVDESIQYFEKARSFTGESGEVLWNLCEAYIDGGYPSLASGLFETMRRLEILNPDIINRTANVFLNQDNCDGAIEMLYYSLELAPNQPMLLPMIEVIGSKRPKIAFFYREKSEELERIINFVGHRFFIEPVEVYVGKPLEEMRKVMEWCDIAWFEGCGEITSELCRREKVCEIVVRLSEDDIYSGHPEHLMFENIDSVVIDANRKLREVLFAKVGRFDDCCRIIPMNMSVDEKLFGFKERSRGKNIACIDELSLKSNPMMLVQCVQKLHFIDNEYRLFWAGEFKDKGLETYIRHIVKRLGLEGVILFEEDISDLNSWFSDKHYIVTAAIGQGGVSGVIKGMSCGLKPVVHRFAGAEEVLGEEFLFDISEDFCDQVLSADYNPQRYRNLAVEKFSSVGQVRVVNDIFVRIETDLMASGKIRREQSVEPVIDIPVGDSVVNKPVSSKVINAAERKEQENPWKEPELKKETFDGWMFDPDKVELEKKAEEFKPFKITPMPVENMNIGREAVGVFESSAAIDAVAEKRHPVVAENVQSSVVSAKKKLSIDKVAAEALEASRALMELAKSGNQNRQEAAGWHEASAGGRDVNLAGYVSVEQAAKEKEVGMAAREFSIATDRASSQAKRVKVHNIPYVG